MQHTHKWHRAVLRIEKPGFRSVNALSASYIIADNSWRPFRRVPLKLEIYEILEGRLNWGKTLPIVETSMYVWSLNYMISKHSRIFVNEFYDWNFVTGLIPWETNHTNQSHFVFFKNPFDAREGDAIWMEICSMTWAIFPARRVILYSVIGRLASLATVDWYISGPSILIRVLRQRT